MFFTSMAMIFGLLGWTANNYLSIVFELLLLSLTGLLGSIILGLWNYKHIQKLLEQLEGE